MHEKFLKRRLEVLKQEEMALIKEHGFVVHIVHPPFEAHTHGLMENFNHPEFECVLPIAGERLFELLQILGFRVRDGEAFTTGLVDRVVDRFPVKLIESSHGLRMIIPDPNGELEKNRMTPEYAKQYNNLGFKGGL